MRKPGTLVLILLAALWHFSALGEEAPAEPAPLRLRGQRYRLMTLEEASSLGLELPEVADSENAAHLYLQAVDSFVLLPRGAYQAYDYVLKHTWLPTEKLLAEWLKRNAQALELVKQVGAKKHCQFPLFKPKDPLLVSIPNPHLSYLRSLANILVVEGKRFEHLQDYQAAATNYTTTLELGKHVCQNPILIPALTGLYALRLGEESLSQLLTRQELSPAVLETLSGKLDTIASQFPDYASTLKMERKSYEQTLEVDMAGEEASAYFPAIKTRMDPHWNQLQQMSELPTSKAIKPMVAFGQMLEQEVRALGEARLDELTWENLKNASGAEQETMEKQLALVFFTNSVGTLLNARIMYARAETGIQALKLIVALNRYQAKSGSWPKALSLLKPDYVGKLPLDPFSSKPFIYALSEGNWTFYSVDWNLIDDGGERGNYPQFWPVKDMVYQSSPKPIPAYSPRVEGRTPGT